VETSRNGRLDLFVAHYLNFDPNVIPRAGTNAGCNYKGVQINCGPRGLPPEPHSLYRNNGDGTFTDATVATGLAQTNYNNSSFGARLFDFDNDGWPDIFVANYGKNRLYRNNHNGTFTDVAEKAGVPLGNWSSGATWGDYDGDGLLDLFVPGYVHWDMDKPPIPGSKTMGYFNCSFRGANTMCGPRGLQGEPDHLFHNNGDGTFTDVSKTAGIAEHLGIKLSNDWELSFFDRKKAYETIEKEIQLCEV